jgi:hypothetical protein
MWTGSSEEVTPAESPYDMCVLTIVGKAYLWHQIRWAPPPLSPPCFYILFYLILAGFSYYHILSIM